MTVENHTLGNIEIRFEEAKAIKAGIKYIDIMMRSKNYDTAMSKNAFKCLVNLQTLLNKIEKI